jgi:hypothetical protein
MAESSKATKHGTDRAVPQDTAAGTADEYARATFHVHRYVPPSHLGRLPFANDLPFGASAGGVGEVVGCAACRHVTYAGLHQ